MIDGKPCFLVGIGGSGMMPLAMILRARGATVAGSDRSLDAGRLAPKFDQLRALGIALHRQDGSGVTSPDQVVIASAAVEATVPDMVAAARLGCVRRTRAETLAALFNDSAVSIGVAGTSGKSTVTGMIGWILHTTGRDPTVMNGAVMKNFAVPETPFASALVGGGAFVSEVDESDGTIALYRPSVAVLNNISLDHKPMAELRALFADYIAHATTAVVNVGDPEAAALTTAISSEKFVTAGVEIAADYTARRLRPEPFACGFDLVTAGATIPVRLLVPGRHNVANALCAIAASVAAGVPLADAASAIPGYTGLSRRFDLVGSAGGVTVLDDFGHNPDKIAATLDTLHDFPGRLLVLFQPHGYRPLKVMRRELADVFVTHLAAEDRLYVPDPNYVGGTVTREVGSADLVADIVAAGRRAWHIADRDDAARTIAAEGRTGDRVVVMGARDDTLSVLARELLRMIRDRLG